MVFSKKETNDCPECAHSRDEGYRYCKACGRDLAPMEKRSITSSLGTVGAVTTVAVAVVLVAELVALIFKFPEVFGYAADHGYAFLLVFPTLFSPGTISGTGMQIVWVLLTIAIFASAYLVVRQSLPVFSTDVLKSEEVRRTPLYWTSVIFAASIICSLLLTFVQQMLGFPLGTPDFGDITSPDNYFSLANAAVWEEINCRLLFIGVPMTIAALAMRREGAWRCLFGGFGFSKFVIILMFISSFLFGYAHSPGWGFEKVLPAMISGLLMAWLYCRFGIHASIIMHFLTDYLSYAMLGPLGVIGGLASTAVIILGIVMFVYVVILAVRAAKGLKDLPTWMAD